LNGEGHKWWLNWVSWKQHLRREITAAKSLKFQINIGWLWWKQFNFLSSLLAIMTQTGNFISSHFTYKLEKFILIFSLSYACLIYVICLFTYSDAQHILSCVFVLFFFVLCTLCCQDCPFLIAPSVFSNVLFTLTQIARIGHVCITYSQNCNLITNLSIFFKEIHLNWS